MEKRMIDDGLLGGKRQVAGAYSYAESEAAKQRDFTS